MIRRSYLKGLAAILLAAGLIQGCSLKQSEPAMAVGDTGSASIPRSEISPTGINPAVSESTELPPAVAALTGEQETQIKILVTALCNTYEPYTFDHIVTDGSVFCDHNLRLRREMQIRFLYFLTCTGYTTEATKLLEPAVLAAEPGKIEFTLQEAGALIRMAGAEPAPLLEENLNYSFHEIFLSERNDQNTIYTLTTRSADEDFPWEQSIEEILRLENGQVTVTGETREKTTGEALYQFEVILEPSDDSIFGGYSVARLTRGVPEPEGTPVIGKALVGNQAYETPKQLSDDPFEYIFELEGGLYQMPVPVKELLASGWTADRTGPLEAGGRENVLFSKDGNSISAVIWNYDTKPSDCADCYVVWLQTAAGGGWSDVDFKLYGGVEAGSGEEALNQYSLYGEWYGKRDPLYNWEYGFELYLENGRVSGFEMAYAPNPFDRGLRVDLMAGKAESGLNEVNSLDIDGDGLLETVSIRPLKQTEWGKHVLGILVDGKMTAALREGTDYQTETLSVQLVEQGAVYRHICQY